MPEKNTFSTVKLLHSIREIPPEIISSSEKHILTILLACLNIDNKTWYSMDSLAKFSCISFSTLKRHLKKLVQKKFIKVDKPDVYTHHITNTYSLNIELIMSFSVDKSDKSVVKMNTDLSTDEQVGSQNEYRLTTSVLKMNTDMPKSVFKMTPLRGKALRGNKRIEERRAEKRAPLSDDFEPSRAACDLAQQWDLTEEEANQEFDKFLRRYKNPEISKTANEWDTELQKWFFYAGEHKRKHPPALKAPHKFFNEEDAKPVHELLGAYANGITREDREG